MDVTIAIVIYFAIGIPFGVLSFALVRGRIEPGDVFRVIYNLVFWPLIAFKSALQYLKPIAAKPLGGDNPRTFAQNPLDIGDRAGRRRTLSQIAIYERMNAAYREMVSASDLRSHFHESIKHPKPEIAAKCVQRRSLTRLER